MAKYTSEPFGVKSKSDLARPDKDQFATTYDILSEGPIEGLANGLSSIFINDIPLIQEQAENILKPRRFKASVTASTATITNAEFGTIDALSFQNKTGLSLGARKIAIEKAGAKGTGIASATADSFTVTTSSSYFTATMLAQCRQSAVPIYLRIAGAGPNGSELRTKVTKFTSVTEVKIADAIATTVSNVDIFFDHFCSLSSISGNVGTVSPAPVSTVSNANIQISTPFTDGLNLSSLFNFKDVEIGFRVGNHIQPLFSPSDSEGTSTLFTPNIQLEQSDLRDVIGTTGNLTANYNDELEEPSQVEGTSADTVLSAAAMGVTAASEVDEVHLTFAFPQSHAIKQSSGAKGASFVELQIFFEYSTDNGTTFTSELAFGPSNNDVLTRSDGRDGRNVNFVINGSTNIPNNGYIKPNPAQFTSFIEEFKIDTREFQPFDTYRIRVRRITDLNFKDKSYQHTNPCTLQSVDNIVKDKLYYPYTSYAKLGFNAKDFDSNIPVRSYLLKGRKVKVPTNYFTRDENNGAATYTRNVSSGAVESTYQTWDGNFRGDTTTFNASSVNFDEVYTDNPVWIFYDLLTNTNYGLGQFIDADQIDKYELFRLAKFCDEEVDDGEGGTEPRFTCNVYITQSTEATNLIKQLASVFRGMAIWMDGQITAISDRRQNPVYTFTKANVKDGVFSYEGTGEKVKVNQIKVTWNDPADNYKQAAEYVEDTQALISSATGKAPRLIRKQLLAFGTTSRGQAHRLGKWKLLSEQTETETVSFVTGPNAIGLKPGNIIAVQDADRDRASYSGRVSNTGTKNTTTIPLDRSVVIPAYSSSFPPQLLLIYPEGGAYLNQDSATISSVDYSKGDLITSVTSSSAAANLTDDSNNHVDVYWSENARIESKTISSPGTSGGTVSSLTVSNAFSAAPNAEVMWSLRIFNTDGTEATGTVKEYKLINIKEAENQEFEIVGAEYNKNKFDLIERGYVIDPRPNDTFPNPEDEVPAPAHITSKLTPSENAEQDTTNSNFNIGHDVNLDWDYPENSDGSRYGFVSGFEVRHNFKGKFITERVETQTQGLVIENVKGGTYEVEIRTISSINTFSLPTKRTIEFSQLHFTTPTAPTKQGKVPKGGLITAPLSIDASTGNASVNAKSSSGGSFQFTNANGEIKTIDSTDTSMYNTTTTLAAGNQGDGTYQLLVDDSATALKYVDERTDTSANPAFTYFKSAGSSTGLTTRTGTITVERGSNKITGSSTTFLTHYEPGDIFHIDNGSSTTRTTGASSSNSTTVTLSSSNSNIKVGQTVTGTFFGTDEATYTNLGGSTVKTSAGEVFVTAISGTTLTVSTPITVANGVTLTFTPRTSYKTVSEIVSDTLMFLDEAVERKYEGAVHKELSFKPDNIKDTIIADVKRTTILGNTTFTLLNEYVDYPVAEESLTFDRLDPDIIITQSDAIASNDNETTIPTSAAVKDYVDNASKNLTNIGTISCDNSITVNQTSGYGFIEMSGTSGAYLDLKSPSSDDYDIRIITTGTGGQINSGSGEVSIQRQGATKLATTSSGIDVTGNIESTGTIISNPASSEGGQLTLRANSGGAKQYSWDVDSSNNLRLIGEDEGTSANGFIIMKSGNGGSDVDFQKDIKMVGTLVMNQARNLVNIGTISSGAITSSLGANKNLRTLALSHDSFSNEGVGLSFSRTTSDHALMAIGVLDADKLSLMSRSGIIFATGGAVAYGETSEVMRIDSSGNVGIGTNSPAQKLHIKDTSNPASPTGSVVIEGQRDGTANLMELRARDHSSSSSALPANQGGIIRMNGFDGTDFEEMAFIGYQAEATVVDGDAPSRLIFGTTSDGSGATTEKMRLTSAGYLGIGTTNPTNKLTVSGNANITGTLASGALTVTGAITATGDVTAFQSSDERLKTNIVKIDSALNKVSQISGYHFEWKDIKDAPHQGKDVGVIAQEIEKVFPEVVHKRDTGYKAVNYQKLTALLIEAVKELKEEIDELKGNK